MDPSIYLSVSYSGSRPQMDYVSQESPAQIADFVANYHRAREILEAISEINRELLRRPGPGRASESPIRSNPAPAPSFAMHTGAPCFLGGGAPGHSSTGGHKHLLFNFPLNQ